MSRFLLAGLALGTAVTFGCNPEPVEETTIDNLSIDNDEQVIDDDQPEDEEPEPEKPEKVVPEVEEDLDCGFNTHETESNACECDDGFTKVTDDQNDWSTGCYAEGVTQFQINLVELAVMPVKMESERPWDWSGNIPMWLEDSIITVIGVFSEDPETASGWVENFNWLIGFAPSLVEGSTPPDMYLEIAVNGDEVFTTDEVDDTLTPSFELGSESTITINEGDVVTLSVIDQDWDWDDTADVYEFDQAFFQEWAGIPLFIGEFNNVYQLDMTISPVFE